MHRATPVNTSHRSYSAGGARTTIDQADDSKLMQESGGNMMKAETRSKVESPQNYGFTSVVHDADKGKDGQITGSAEGFMSFMGGNRSFPVCGVMDDRRHRLKGLEKGDTAMFRGKDDGQQFHMTKDGGFWSAQTEKTVRMQLVDKQQQQQQGGGSGGGSSGGASTFAGDGGAGDSGGGASGAGGGASQMGQKPVYKDGQKSYRFVDVTKDATRLSGNESHMMLSDGDSYVHCKALKTYLGGHADKHKFARVLTEAGPAKNVFGRIDALTAFEVDDAPGSTLARAKPALVPALMLALGLSLGVNYSVLTGSAAPSPPTMLANACSMASR